MWMSRNKQPKILIVEDDVNNHPVYRDAFTNAGFVVMISDTADGDFVSSVTGFAPDLISMDLMIGKHGQPAERDGFDAITLLKQDERTANIPIIILTNFFQEANLSRAHELGVVDYVTIQGQTITQIAKRFRQYADNPKRYMPLREEFA